MKKFLFLAVAVLGMFTSTYAQRATLMPLMPGDTLTNTDTLNKVFTVSAGYSSIAVQPVVTKISGTVAGNVIFQGSLDGTNYQDLDTLALSNVATNSAVFAHAPTPYVHYRVRFITSGTQSYVPRIYYVLRKHD